MKKTGKVLATGWILRGIDGAVLHIRYGFHVSDIFKGINDFKVHIILAEEKHEKKKV